MRSKGSRGAMDASQRVGRVEKGPERGLLATPSWILGPGLIVPPIFIALVICVWPRPVAPVLPTPRVDGDLATQHLERLMARVDGRGSTDEELALADRWGTVHQELLNARERGQRSNQDLALAQTDFRRDVQLFSDEHGVEALLVLGDRAALSVLRHLTATRQPESRLASSVQPAARGFVNSARSVGLLGQAGELRTHTVIALTLIRMGWRLDCGLDEQVGFDAVSRESVDVFRLRFSTAASLDQRLEALERYSRRHEDYPVERARTALFVAAGERERAYVHLLKQSRREPGRLVLRNNLLALQTNEN